MSGLREDYLRRADGDAERAALLLARDLMKGDPESLKAGYSEQNAALAAGRMFGCAAGVVLDSLRAVPWIGYEDGELFVQGPCGRFIVRAYGPDGGDRDEDEAKRREGLAAWPTDVVSFRAVDTEPEQQTYEGFAVYKRNREGRDRWQGDHPRLGGAISYAISRADYYDEDEPEPETSDRAKWAGAEKRRAKLYYALDKVVTALEGLDLGRILPDGDPLPGAVEEARNALAND